MSKLFWVNVKALRNKICGMSCASVRGVMYQLHQCTDSMVSTKQQPADTRGYVAIDEDAYNKFRLCDPLWALPMIAYAIPYLHPKFNVFCEFPDEEEYTRAKPMTSEQLFEKIESELGRAEQIDSLRSTYRTLQSVAQRAYIDSGFNDDVFSATLERVGLAVGDHVLSVDEYVERETRGDIQEECIAKSKEYFDSVIDGAVINFGSPEKKHVFLCGGDGFLHASGFLFPNCGDERKILFASELIDCDFYEVVRYLDEEPLAIEDYIDFDILKECYDPTLERDGYRIHADDEQSYNSGKVIILCRERTKKAYLR